jgi:hypothetical protein
MKRKLFLLLIGLLSGYNWITCFAHVFSPDSIETGNIKAYIHIGEYNNEVLTRSLSNLLTNNYFPVVTDPDMANVLVRLKCSIDKGGIIKGEMYNLREYFTTVAIQIENGSDSKVLFQYSVNNHRSLASVSTSETSAHNMAVRDVMKSIERELDRKLKKELNTINKAVYIKKVPQRSARTVKSAISLKDTYNTHLNKKRLSERERESLKTEKIACNSIVFQSEDFVRGITAFPESGGRMESVIYIADQGVFEYLVSYNESGNYSDCLEIGCIMKNSPHKTAAVIEGNKITLITTLRELPEEGTSTAVYYVSPQLRFLRESNERE